MISIRSRLGVVVLALMAIIGGYLVARPLLEHMQFARAAEEVELSRQQLQSVSDLSTVFRHVGKVVEPSVVNIHVVKTIHQPKSQPQMDDELRKFFHDHGGDGLLPPGNDPGDGENGGGGGDLQEIGTGSGVIMEAKDGFGYILTNNHVAGDATEMQITLSDGRTMKGKLLGADVKSDLAVVQIKADRLIPATWGNSDDLEKGDWVLAFGSPFGYIGSMTHGIVSALNRHDVGILGQNGYEDFIQVDAPINPGNSGGPLVNVRGEVIGINTAIATRSGGFQGIGFAIPSNQAKVVYGDLKDHGKVVRGWLGVSIRDVAKDPQLAKTFHYDGEAGVLVEQTFNNTPATGKLHKGDILVGFDAQKVDNVQQLRGFVAATAPGTEVTLKVFRGGKVIDVKITIGNQPEDVASALNPDQTVPEQAPADTAPTQAMGMTMATLDKDTAAKLGITDATDGAVVTAIARNSVAAAAGVRPGDVITSVGDTVVHTAAEAAVEIGKGDLAQGIRLYVGSKDGSRFVLLQKEAAN